jgi:protein-tyrosine-phosphatase
LKKILFVCSGNTCRSPLAEVSARQVFAEMDISICSAGTSAMNGSPASENSIEIARANGMDLTAHRSRMLDRELVREADLIVTMGGRHRQMVGALDPDALDYTFLLTNFSEQHHGDIPDPIGGSLELYQRTYGVIRECVESMARHLPGFDGYKNPAHGRKDRA